MKGIARKEFRIFPKFVGDGSHAAHRIRDSVKPKVATYPVSRWCFRAIDQSADFAIIPPASREVGETDPATCDGDRKVP